MNNWFLKYYNSNKWLKNHELKNEKTHENWLNLDILFIIFHIIFIIKILLKIVTQSI